MLYKNNNLDIYMSLFPIFKVNYLINRDTVNKIIVFYGLNLDIKNVNELFDTDPNNIAFKDVFTSSELIEIKEKGIEVIFLNETIHIDDTIGSIKLKIVTAFSNTFSEEEIYLYCLKEELLNPITIYQTLTLNDKIPLTKIRLEQLLLNICDENGKPISFPLETKEKYNFDDILKLNLAEEPCFVAKILGQKIIMGNNEYPFIADPFYVEKYDVLLERSRKELSTLNNSLLLDTGKINRNNIYLCVATDVFQYCETKSISLEYTSKIYFPFLYKLHIDNQDLLDERRQSLINESVQKIDTFKRTFQNIDLFYNIFQYKQATDVFSLNAKNTGIKNIKIVMHPAYKVKIPIDVIFKLVHATINVPLLKYNQSSRQENIYRLYANKLTKLAKFLEKPVGTEMARTDVTREINKYIRFHNLQDKENGRKINPDGKLSSLLKLKKTDELTYFNLQRYMSPHFFKATKDVVTVTASA